MIDRQRKSRGSDVDGDGTADLVWQRVADGQVHYWRMLDGKRQTGIDIDLPVSSDWTLRGIGEVDGDGTADIVLATDDGQVHYWRMLNGQRQAGIKAAPDGSGSSVIGAESHLMPEPVGSENSVAARKSIGEDAGLAI